MISMRGVTVRFGTLTALNDLNLELAAGEAFGYIGPNGAGKSTTMKILAGLLRPNTGVVKVDGLEVGANSREVRRRVGYMPDFLGVYDDLTVDEYLRFFASAFKIDRRKRTSLIGEILELTDLTEKRHAMVESLSRGMQQRLGIARVLVHDPKVLLLDEPASGLDPRARIEMRSLLVELRRMGKTIMVSSHILSELHEMCTSIGIIERGELLFAGTLDEAFDRAGGHERIHLRVETKAQGAVDALSADERVRSAKIVADEIVVDLSPGTHGHHFLFDRLNTAGIRIVSFTPKEEKLEDVFLRLTKGAVQ